jgi:putative two-component system response regulator
MVLLFVFFNAMGYSQFTFFDLIFVFLWQKFLIHQDTKKNKQLTSSIITGMNTENSNNLKILVIDDEPMILDVVSQALENHGFDVFSAINGELGIEIFRKEQPILVLTDINMPKMSGFDILKIIKNESPTTQLVVFSGVGTTGDVIQALRLGACNYIYKPLSVEFLVHTVNRCIERYELIQERISRNELLEKQVTERTVALMRTFHATVTSLGRLIEMRDPYTSGHQNRVALLAVSIGEKLGMTRNELEVIQVASLLHDIGKAAVPAELLVKPSGLTNQEFELIKCHPQAGYDVLKDIPFIDSLGKNVAIIVRQHHERIDGTGYPQGLKDGEIEPESKILSVADVLEAMSSHRPYRPALDIKAAKTELVEKKNKHYDPECVNVCMQFIEENNNDPSQLFKPTTRPLDNHFQGPDFHR